MGGASLWGLFRLATKRLRSDPGLTLGTLLGLVAVVAIAASVPIYVEAANNKILRQELGEIEAGGSPAFAYMYHMAYPSGPTSTAEFHAADSFLLEQAPRIMHLPLEAVCLSVNSERLGLFPATADLYGSTKNQLGNVQIGFVRHLQQHARLLEGAWPAPPTSLDGPFEALLAVSRAEQLGIKAGETFHLFRESENFGRVELAVRIAGIWEASDPTSSFWFMTPDVYEEVLLFPESTYMAYLMPGAEDWALSYAAWYLTYDGRSISAEDVPTLLASMGRVLSTLKSVMPSIGVPVSPEWALIRHRRAVNMQNKLLLAFGLPIMALVLFFTAFLSSLSIQHRSREVALFRSRGASVRQVLFLFLFQGIILGLLALLLGLPAGMGIAQLIGRTQSFLSFDLSRASLAVQITPQSLRVGLAVMACSILFYLIPALRAARLTVVSFWQRVARWTALPWWQRSFLDLVLVAVVAYGSYVLKSGQGLSFLVAGQGDPLQQPLVLITPSLFLLVGVLLFLRIAPHLLGLVAWLAELGPGVSLLLTFRQLARSTRRYAGVLLLLALSVGLSLFTASMAYTLDRNLVDRAYYRTGADLAVQEKGWGLTAQDVKLQELMQGATEEEEETLPGSVFSVIPSDEALDVPGVRGVTRVYRFALRTVSTAVTERGTLIGIDRYTFPEAAFFRADFGPGSLGQLMNALALDSSGALVDRQFLARHSLDVGDTLLVRVDAVESQPFELRIVGALELFPGVKAKDFPLVVASSDYVLTSLGVPLPGQLWLRVDPGIEAAAIMSGLQEAGFRVTHYDDARGTVNKEQGQLLRVGLFGFLSVGFIAVSMLSVLSLIIYAFMSFQERAIQFGVLQAIGLSKGQLERQFALEQAVIVLLGVTVGTALGVYGCRLFLPYFQVTYAAISPLPPMIVAIAWQDMAKIYALLGGALLVLGLIALRLLRNLRIFEAVKLGTQMTG